MKSKVEDFLEFYPPEIREMVDYLSSIIFENVDSVKEKVYSGWKGLGYSKIDCGYFVGIFPNQETVKLGFENGSLMKDDYKLFTDKKKKVSYIEFESYEKIQNNKNKIIEYLLEAIKIGKNKS